MKEFHGRLQERNQKIDDLEEENMQSLQQFQGLAKFAKVCVHDKINVFYYFIIEHSASNYVAYKDVCTWRCCTVMYVYI